MGPSDRSAIRLAVHAVVYSLSIALMGGCATYVPEPISSTVSMRAFESRTLDDVELQQYVNSHLEQSGGAAAITHWNLASLSYAAFYLNPDLDVARAKLAVSEAAVVTAAENPNPSLQLPFTYASNPKPGDTPYTLGLGLDIPIETAGKRGYRIQRARQLSVAAQLDIGHVAWQVRSRLRGALLDLNGARRRTSILQRQVETQEAVVAIFERRLAVGAASEPEVNQVRASLNRDRVDLAKARLAASDALAAVAQAIGLPLAALVNTDIQLKMFASIPSSVPDLAAQETALHNRPDILAALARYQASQAALQLEVANQYPDVHLGAGYTYDAGTKKFSFGLASVALPVFNRNEGPIAEAMARRRQAATEFNALQAQVIGEVSRAAEQYRNALATLRVSDSLLELERLHLAAQREALSAGEIDRLTVVLAEHDVQTAALARQEGLIQVEVAVGRLEDAMERPLPDDGVSAVRK